MVEPGREMFGLGRPPGRSPVRSALIAASSRDAAITCLPFMGTAASPPTVPVDRDPPLDATAVSSAPWTRTGALFLEMDRLGGDPDPPFDGNDARAWNG